MPSFVFPFDYSSYNLKIFVDMDLFFSSKAPLLYRINARLIFGEKYLVRSFFIPYHIVHLLLN